MTLIINPGSGPVAAGTSWTNTVEGALAEARRWHDGMIRDGFGHDVELLPLDMHRQAASNAEGRWLFEFRHRVTGAVVELETHGIDNVDAYMKARVFAPRVYWNGSSSASPTLGDFAVSGFVQTYRTED